ncbi:MAG: 6-carboxytetrahydropterin synthase QueD [Pseudodesulfovibrio sp.]|jgi:6-pyruvoyltetrahydropterin/6-carboxytetrahydropterin synthase|uniref:6-carboxy-5,6,7,8-tetrahydropterin synthase n=1 Tax=Pseudodesulfovibrio indicus TaxID=1716143 RepID=A0A140D8T8_9BACT|nr:6-carboxytetrahydropterin synthase QueD [Pseudodesulfovibrio indicus]AMK09605.1 6-pyruvoyl tetrahydrobiopterin synthase [Pseudodesulfovibrio indicus]TDT86448.1 6-pyruvoyltetrahydropterin/6-carboxytetrahydropterin synthase [Pseudodesulfovibrio indicus]
MPGKWKLTITQEFSASHQLRNYCGKCENMHGHNFGVEVVVEGDTLDEKVQYLLDFKDLKARTRTVLDKLDHKHLNDVECFTEINPSSENLAMFIYRNLKGNLPGHVSLVEVSVSEKGSSKATYWEE